MRWARALVLMAGAATVITAQDVQPTRRNAIIFVADGLRHGSVNPTDTPALYRVRTEGVYFANSHARSYGYNTAALGKTGPAASQDLSEAAAFGGKMRDPVTIILEGATGTPRAVPLGPDTVALLKAAGLPPAPPPRTPSAGTNTTAGTRAANVEHQQWFADAATKAILPAFARSPEPFVPVYWSGDPDHTQHAQGDSPSQLSPGINGATSNAAVQNADRNLKQILDYLDANPELRDVGLMGGATTPKPAIVVSFKSFPLDPKNPHMTGIIVGGTRRHGQGDHGSLARANTFNNMAAIGPDFKKGFVSRAPVSNADVQPTLAHLMQMHIPSAGALKGRIITEALAGGPATVRFAPSVMRSRPRDGFSTVLMYQVADRRIYLDEACFTKSTKCD